jgi:hypothetical protein
LEKEGEGKYQMRTVNATTQQVLIIVQCSLSHFNWDDLLADQDYTKLNSEIIELVAWAKTVDGDIESRAPRLTEAFPSRRRDLVASGSEPFLEPVDESHDPSLELSSISIEGASELSKDESLQPPVVPASQSLSHRPETLEIPSFTGLSMRSDSTPINTEHTRFMDVRSNGETLYSPLTSLQKPSTGFDASTFSMAPEASLSHEVVQSHSDTQAHPKEKYKSPAPIAEGQRYEEMLKTLEAQRAKWDADIKALERTVDIMGVPASGALKTKLNYIKGKRDGADADIVSLQRTIEILGIDDFMDWE